METEIVGIDLGNKQTKLMSSKKAYRLPSHFMVKETEGLSGVNIQDDNDLDIHTFSGLEDNKTYAWGSDINKIGSFSEMKDTIGLYNNRYSNDWFLLLSQFALGLLGSDFMGKNKEVHFTVVTGIPTEDYEDDDIVNELKNALQKNVIINVDNEPVNVQVDKVIVMPQPVGTVVDCIQNEKKQELKDEYISVIDVGGGTLLIDTLKRLAYEPEENEQLKLGSFKLFKDIATKSKIKPKPSAYDIEDTIRKGLEDDDGKFIYHVKLNKDIDITEIVNNVINDYTKDVINKVKQTVTNLDLVDEIIFTGGTSSILNRELIKQAFPEVIFASHGEMSNVYGFYKYGIDALG